MLDQTIPSTLTSSRSHSLPTPIPRLNPSSTYLLPTPTTDGQLYNEVSATSTTTTWPTGRSHAVSDGALSNDPELGQPACTTTYHTPYSPLAHSPNPNTVDVPTRENDTLPCDGSSVARYETHLTSWPSTPATTRMQQDSPSSRGGTSLRLTQTSRFAAIVCDQLVETSLGPTPTE